MTRFRFGSFLAPHHPLGEHPALLFQRDLDLVEQLDKLGFDEFWVGEHHSSGWEMIDSPEMFLAAAAQRSSRIKLGTGVVSLPYHHPFNSVTRMVQLDHMCQGRAIFGTGPGALPSDAAMFGIDTVKLRDRQDEALSVITRLLAGETVSYDCEWFKLENGVLQLRPYQEQMEMVVASSISPSGMQLAGKYGMGIMSVGSTSPAGLSALQTQWAFAEESAKKHGQTVDRSAWRIVMSWHIAETREQAEEEVLHGLHRWHNEYTVGALGMPDAKVIEDPRELLAQTTGAASGRGGTVTIGTPDDVIQAIGNLQELTGGFGCALGFVHDWANPTATRRSWDMFARYVMPAIGGHTAGLQKSYEHVAANRTQLMSNYNAGVMAKIKGNARAEAELEITLKEAAGAPSGAVQGGVDLKSS